MQRATKGGYDRQNVPEMDADEKSWIEWLKTNPSPEEIIEFVKELDQVLRISKGYLALERLAESEECKRAVERLPADAQEAFKALCEGEESIIRHHKANEYLYNFAIKTAAGSFQTHDSGQNVINDSPVLKNMLAGSKRAEIVLGTNPETGEAAIFTLLSGYITPYEKEIIECVSKFKLDGQLTDKGKIWFTVGQLYRAMRHGKGTQSPTPEQRAAIMETLTELSKPERKLTFKLNDYLKTWGGFETNGGRVRLIGFDELFGRVQGQEDILIILDDTPVICAVAENLHMWEPIPQEVKAIQQARYTLEYKEGDKIIKRSFATNEARLKYCKKNGITGAAIEAHGIRAKPWALSENRIALRSVLLTFVYGYIRARSAGRNHSNKLSYEQIFTRCGVSENREAQKRARADIAVILNHFVKKVDGLRCWTEYTNRGNTKPDGIQISIGDQITEGG